MQFLVYLTVLMVSISTVLLEVHWLTSPAPQPKPVIQATSRPVPVQKVEGPNAALSPVYPKKPDVPPPVDSASNSQPSNAASDPQAASAQTAAAPPTASAAPPQQPPAETTGAAARDDDAKQPAPALVATNVPPQPTPVASNVSQRASQESAPAASPNRCDVQACAGAYKSFRASDCTYQSFEGPRRVCTKPTVQRTAREQKDEPERRKWSRDVNYPRNADRSTVGRRMDLDDDDDDDRAANVDEDADRIVIRRFFGPRW
jgi:BA14K-like protein